MESAYPKSLYAADGSFLTVFTSQDEELYVARGWRTAKPRPPETPVPPLEGTDKKKPAPTKDGKPTKETSDAEGAR